MRRPRRPWSLLLWADFNLNSLCTSLENMVNKCNQNADLLEFHENHSCPRLVLYRQNWAACNICVHHYTLRAPCPTGQGSPAGVVQARVAQNARGVVKGVVKGVTRASFGRRAPRAPQLQRASARHREEIDFRGVYMIQQVAAVHLG